MDEFILFWEFFWKTINKCIENVHFMIGKMQGCMSYDCNGRQEFECFFLKSLRISFGLNKIIHIDLNLNYMRHRAHV